MGQPIFLILRWPRDLSAVAQSAKAEARPSKDAAPAPRPRPNEIGFADFESHLCKSAIADLIGSALARRAPQGEGFNVARMKRSEIREWSLSTRIRFAAATPKSDRNFTGFWSELFLDRPIRFSKRYERSGFRIRCFVIID